MAHHPDFSGVSTSDWHIVLIYKALALSFLHELMTKNYHPWVLQSVLDDILGQDLKQGLFETLVHDNQNLVGKIK